MTNLQSELIEALKGNGCNISSALKKTGATLKQYNDFMLLPAFREGQKEAEQLKRDYSNSAFMKLIKAGEKQAIIEHQKMLRQSADEVSLKKIQKEFMRVMIQLADTKTLCIKEYCSVFGTSQKMSEKQYTAVIAEYNLETPFERSKKIKKDRESMMSTLFDAGKLSEVDMYSRMLSKSLYDSENSEYPSERSKARADVISINQRLDEIQERERRELESDNTSLVDKLDAALSGSTPEEVEILKAQFIQGPMAIEEDE